MRTSSVEKLILSILERERDHLTANRIFALLRPGLPALNPSTVYRAMERLARVGRVSVSDMGQGPVVYAEAGRPAHHHLVCENCRRTLTIRENTVRPLLQAVSRQFHFRVTTNHLVLFGICPSCRRKSPPPFATKSSLSDETDEKAMADQGNSALSRSPRPRRTVHRKRSG
jgi:Fur family transcriptional regulator, ferric uptake regulator